MEKGVTSLPSLPGAQRAVSRKFYESEGVGADGEEAALSHLHAIPHFPSRGKYHHIPCHGPPWEHLADVAKTQSLAKGPLVTQLQPPGLLHDPGWGPFLHQCHTRVGCYVGLVAMLGWVGGKI